MNRGSNDSINDPAKDSNLDWMLENMKWNVMADHVYYIEHGISKVDDDYPRYKAMLIEKLGRKEYVEYMQRQDKDYPRAPKRIIEI
jgi:hypothetical protein